MPATAARAAFVQEEFRSATWQNQNVRDLYGKVARDTKDQPIPTFFDDMWAVQAMVNERGALLGNHARAFDVTVDSLIDLSSDLDMSQVLPAATIASDELVADFDVAVAAVKSYDTENGRTALAVWGVCATITEAGGGTGWGTPTIPAWVEALRAPSGQLPTLAADFKAATPTFWLDNAEVTEADLFVGNGTWGSYTPGAAVSGSGLPQNEPVLTNDAKAAVGSQCTVVMSVKFSDDDQRIGFEYADPPTYGVERFAQINTTGWTTSTSTVKVDDGVQDVTASPAGASGTGVSLKLAATLGLTHLAGSTDGEDPAVTASSSSPAVGYTTIGIFMNGPSGAYLETLVVYPVQPDVDLPTLSS